MYYRNANCAVVVYDITQSVRPTVPRSPALRSSFTVLPRQSKGLGKGAPAPSQREHHHRPRRKQARSRHRTARQARHPDRRRRGLRARGRPALLRDLRKDGRERARALHRNRQKAAARPGWAATCAPWAKAWCQPGSRELQHQHERPLQLLDGLARMGVCLGATLREGTIDLYSRRDMASSAGLRVSYIYLMESRL